MRGFRSRRDFLFQSCGGVSGLGLAYLLNQEGLLAGETCSTASPVASPLVARKPQFEPRAKAMISLFMSGGVSHVDTFDPKPALRKYAGLPLEGKGDVVVRQGNPGPLMPSPFEFRKYGESGIEVSELFPHMASKIDDLAVLRSVKGQSNDHVQAHYEFSTGMIRAGYPSMGAWITYGLGS